MRTTDILVSYVGNSYIDVWVDMDDVALREIEGVYMVQHDQWAPAKKTLFYDPRYDYKAIIQDLIGMYEDFKVRNTV